MKQSAAEEGKMPDDILLKDGISEESQSMPKEVKRSFLFILASIFLWFTAYNAVTSAYSRYAEEVWNLKAGGFTDSLLVATIAAIISYIPIGIISSKIGRKKTIIIGIIMMTASYLCGTLIPEYSSIVNIIFAFTGIGWAAISVNSYPMVVEMCKGSDIGKYTGLYYTFSMSAQIMTPILSGALLEYVSYRTLFPYAVFFSVASLCTMLFVKHGDSRPPKKMKTLENFDTAD
jgi:MFS family permease